MDTQPEIPSTTQPEIQIAQICAWCGDYLYSYQNIDVYAGLDPKYTNWMVHADCNELFNKPKH